MQRKSLSQVYSSIYNENIEDIQEDQKLIDNLTSLVNSWSSEKDIQVKIDQLLTLLAGHKGIIQNIQSKMN